MNPRSASVDTERELIVKGRVSTRTYGYYFCVMKSSTSNDIAVSQLVSVPSGIDVTYYRFFVYIQNLGVQYANMTREDPFALSLSRTESLAVSTEQSIPGSAGSLAREPKAKKAS